MRKLTLLLSAMLLTSFNGWADVNDAILFKNAAVEKICVDNWDTNGDGKLSYAEAAAVTSLDGKFSNNKEIKSFDEFKYFTGVTETVEQEFYNSSLVSITMPESMKKLGIKSFCCCDSLKNIIFNDSLETIDEYCFSTCSVQSLDLPDNVSSIGNAAFMYCYNIKSFKMPANCNVVPDYMLCDCNLLENITLHDNVTTIVGGAFHSTAIKTFHIGKNLQSIDSPFSKCLGLGDITIDPENKWFTFTGKALYSQDGKTLYKFLIQNKDTVYTVPDGVEELKSAAFEYTKITQINLPQSLTSVGHTTFSDCHSLKSIALPEGVTEIGNRTFAYCDSLKSITFSSKLESFDWGSFEGCVRLEKIVLPETLTYLGNKSFEGCDNLNEIVSYSKTGDFELLTRSSLIPEGKNKRVVYVPAGCKDTYMANDYWANAHEIIEMESTGIDGVEGAETITVNGVKVDVNGCDDIYSVEGVLVKRVEAGEKNVNLPAGIYVINGKKIVVR